MERDITRGKMTVVGHYTEFTELLLACDGDIENVVDLIDGTPEIVLSEFIKQNNKVFDTLILSYPVIMSIIAKREILGVPYPINDEINFFTEYIIGGASTENIEASIAHFDDQEQYNLISDIVVAIIDRRATIDLSKLGAFMRVLSKRARVDDNYIHPCSLFKKEWLVAIRHKFHKTTGLIESHLDAPEELIEVADNILSDTNQYAEIIESVTKKSQHASVVDLTIGDDNDMPNVDVPEEQPVVHHDWRVVSNPKTEMPFYEIENIASYITTNNLKMCESTMKFYDCDKIKSIKPLLTAVIIGYQPNVQWCVNEARITPDYNSYIYLLYVYPLVTKNYTVADYMLSQGAKQWYDPERLTLVTIQQRDIEAVKHLCTMKQMYKPGMTFGKLFRNEISEHAGEISKTPDNDDMFNFSIDVLRLLHALDKSNA